MSKITKCVDFTSHFTVLTLQFVFKTLKSQQKGTGEKGVVIVEISLNKDIFLAEIEVTILSNQKTKLTS